MTSYWDEYQSLMGELPVHHRNDFGMCRLMLDASDEWPELKAYFQFLINRAAPLRPVLQMNRVDFRLPWLRASFPGALIVHLFRRPRDQWRSMTRDLPAELECDPDENTKYDLVAWAVSLSRVFPFLVGPHIRHGYERHYLLWKLSYLMGSRCSDLSLSYDRDVIADPERGIVRLLKAIAPGASVTDVLAGVRSPARIPSFCSAEIARFNRMEGVCDELLERLGLLDGFGRRSLAEIRQTHALAWEPFAEEAQQEAVRLSGVVFSRLRSRYLRTVTDMRRLAVNARNVQQALAERDEQLRVLTGGCGP